MLDLRLIEKDPTILSQSLLKRNYTQEETQHIIQQITHLAEDRKKGIQQTDDLKNQRNQISKEFGTLKKRGEDVSSLSKKMTLLKEELENLDNQLEETENQLNQILLNLPNILSPDVPLGKTDADNQEIEKFGNIPQFNFEPLPHWELGEKWGFIDFKRGSRIAGSRFYVLLKEGAKLERALINFFLDFYGKRGYEEVWPPYLVNKKTMTGTGQLPKFEEDLFKIADTDYYLIPTAEVPVTNLYADEVLEAKDLPQYYCSFTACFRKEAGSYGKDTRGIIRVHQFSKVELVKFSLPQNSEAEHQKLVQDAADALKALGLPYRIMLLCGGDTGFAAQKCYDLEVWVPSEKKYREISSVSNFGDFQSRRANIKYKTQEGKRALLHTLNGSGLAIGRTMLAILENYQKADGSITVPPVLVPYLNGLTQLGGKN